MARIVMCLLVLLAGTAGIHADLFCSPLTGSGSGSSSGPVVCGGTCFGVWGCCKPDGNGGCGCSFGGATFCTQVDAQGIISSCTALCLLEGLFGANFTSCVITCVGDPCGAATCCSDSWMCHGVSPGPGQFGCACSQSDSATSVSADVAPAITGDKVMNNAIDYYISKNATLAAIAGIKYKKSTIT